MRKTISIGIFCLLSSFGLLAQNDSLHLDALTFEEAASYMSLNNYVLHQSNYKVAQMEEEVKAKRALRLPNITLSANYVLMSDNIELDMSPIKDAISPLYETLSEYGVFSSAPYSDLYTSAYTEQVRASLAAGLEELEATDWTTVIQNKNFGSINANFVLPIYTGGKINAANKAAKLELHEAEVQRDLKQDELFCELVERYYGLVLSNHALEVRQEVLSTMEAHRDEAEKLKKHGMIAEAEYLHAKVYYSDAEREYKKAVRENAVVNNALLNTLSSEASTQVLPVSQLFYLDSLESLSYYQAKAQENNAMLALVNSKKELAHEGYKAERAAWMPSIAAMGTYTLADHELSSALPDYFVGVGLNWTLFEGASRLKKSSAAKYQEDQVEAYSQQAELNVNMAVQKYHQEVQIQLEQLHDLETAGAFAEEYYRVRLKAFHEGMATTTEVADANLALAKVKIDRLQAVYNYDVALAKLLFYAGILNEFQAYQQNPATKTCNES